MKEGVIEPWQKIKLHGETRFGFVYPLVDSEETYQETSVLPPVVKEWAGMKHSNGSYDNEEGAQMAALSSDNDNGKSFARIADIIEARYLEL